MMKTIFFNMMFFLIILVLVNGPESKSFEIESYEKSDSALEKVKLDNTSALTEAESHGSFVSQRKYKNLFDFWVDFVNNVKNRNKNEEMSVITNDSTTTQPINKKSACLEIPADDSKYSLRNGDMYLIFPFICVIIFRFFIVALCFGGLLINAGGELVSLK